jgi:hypothetical protein
MFGLYATRNAAIDSVAPLNCPYHSASRADARTLAVWRYNVYKEMDEWFAALETVYPTRQLRTMVVVRCWPPANP